MAITANRDEAFGVGFGERKATKETYQLNVSIDRRLMKPIKIAHLDKGKPICHLVEDLIIDFLVDEGYIDDAEAKAISDGR